MSISEGLSAALRRYRRDSQRLRGRAEHSHQRLDIQGLRMVAVLLVFATHLFGWPRGGFIGVDVFFVISGYLITGNLLRTAEKTGNVSFLKFYWNRVRRIVPAATAVLILTYLASVVVFLPFRAHQVGIDALAAFFFVSNWRFAAQETDYFASGNAVSPIQHYWSLSIEEQFYFVWPALIFVIGLLIARKAWSHSHRMRMAGAVMGVVVAVSLGWALYESAVSPTWAYFNTFSRVWELGVGALLATSVGALARIPAHLTAWLSWTGLALIAASVLLIAEGAAGFPAPWALLPVAGSALVIAAGVGGEPAHQGFLRNPIAVYIGNISYSLYLVHWPVIVLLGAFFASRGASFYVAVLALAFGLAIASYHFVENPLRHGSWGKARNGIEQLRRGGFQPSTTTGYRAVAILALLTVSVIALAMRPSASLTLPPEVVAAPTEFRPEPNEPTLGPLGTALRQQLDEALKATEWPRFDPSILSMIEEPSATPPDLGQCGGLEFPDPQACTFGAPTATTRIVLVGDSVALGYGETLREIASNSGGQVQLRIEAMAGCAFYNEDQKIPDRPAMEQACRARKEHAIEVINATKPDVVIISNWTGWLGPGQWGESVRQIVEKFRGSTKTVAWLSPPPGDKNFKECFGKRSSVPADCISRVTTEWALIGNDASKSVGATLIDSQPWFCTAEGICPAFVESTPTKYDVGHIFRAYATVLYPVMRESMAASGLLG